MNLYHCFIDLNDTAKPLAFSAALENWMNHLQGEGVIQSWRLMRRKLNLASGGARDFLLEIEFEDLSQVDSAFDAVARRSDEVDRLYAQLTPMIAKADFSLYRSFPDPDRSERVSLL